MVIWWKMVYIYFFMPLTVTNQIQSNSLMMLLTPSYDGGMFT